MSSITASTPLIPWSSARLPAVLAIHGDGLDGLVVLQLVEVAQEPEVDEQIRPRRELGRWLGGQHARRAPRRARRRRGGRRRRAGARRETLRLRARRPRGRRRSGHYPAVLASAFLAALLAAHLER